MLRKGRAICLRQLWPMLQCSRSKNAGAKLNSSERSCHSRWFLQKSAKADDQPTSSLHKGEKVRGELVRVRSRVEMTPNAFACLAKRCLRPWQVPERVEQHEIVDHAVVADRGHVHAGILQL